MSNPILVTELQSPCVILNHDKIKRNAERMISRAQEFGVQLRPHFKTTKCVEAALLQTAGTKRRMVVSTLPEAQLLFENGFDDLLLGVPLSLSKIPRCSVFTESMEYFCVMIDAQQMADHISSCDKSPLKKGKRWNVFLKVDCDNGRCGVLHDSETAIEVAKTLNESANVNFCGLYAHCGDSYHNPGVAAIQKVADKTCNYLINFKERLRSIGVECKTVGIGSTPTCSQPSKSMKQLTEWHPGNYILYDQMQVRKLVN